MKTPAKAKSAKEPQIFGHPVSTHSWALLCKRGRHPFFLATKRMGSSFSFMFPHPMTSWRAQTIRLQWASGVRIYAHEAQLRTQNVGTNQVFPLPFLPPRKK